MITEKALKITHAFRDGYRVGTFDKELSTKEALEIHANYSMDELTAFCQGTVDGAKKDSFRYLLSYIAT